MKRKTLSRKCYIKGVYTNGGVERRNGGGGGGFPYPNISHSHMYTINNNIALVIACNVLLVDKQEI